MYMYMHYDASMLHMACNLGIVVVTTFIGVEIGGWGHVLPNI